MQEEPRDADLILITLGSISGLVRDVVDELREEGVKAGMIRIRFMRPFPAEELIRETAHASAVGVLEKDISFGFEGTVYSNVNSALSKSAHKISTYDFIGGIGGKNISKEDVRTCFDAMQKKESEEVRFIGLEVEDDI